MSSSEERVDELLDRLTLDVKALVLLEGSDEGLRNRLQGRFAGSHDESLRRFVDSLQSKKRPGTIRLVAMALGEIALASLLVLAGALTLIPIMVGITSPQGLIDYFVGQFYGSLQSSPFYQYTALIEFGIGALLMLSAFYTLHQAALNFREMGLAIKSGEK